jgi:Heavy metal binding domain
VRRSVPRPRVGVKSKVVAAGLPKLIWPSAAQWSDQKAFAFRRSSRYCVDQRGIEPGDRHVTHRTLEITRREFGVALVATISRATLAAAQKPSPASELPPVSWTCPMHAEVFAGAAGKCPICTMDLVAVRLVVVWTCPVHTTVAELEAGRCRTCRRDLVRIIKGMSWTCRLHPKVDVIEPGRCPTCKRTLTLKYSDRPHGDHNPKHGGQFFMAPNNWHLEVTHPAPGIFRIYCYDDYSKPFMPNGFTARLEERSGPGKPVVHEPVPFTLLQRRSPYLEARVPSLGLPAIIVAKVQFQAGQPEYRFDFQFYEYSKEPAPQPAPP